MLAAIRAKRCGFVGCAPIGLSYKRTCGRTSTPSSHGSAGSCPRPSLRRLAGGTATACTIRRTSSTSDGRLGLPLEASAAPARRACPLCRRPPMYVPYRVAWVGSCVLYNVAKLRAAGGFTFWRELPERHAGEDVLAQLRVMARFGGCGSSVRRRAPRASHHGPRARRRRAKGALGGLAPAHRVMPSPRRLSRAEDLHQHDGLVVLLVLRAIQQRHGAVLLLELPQLEIRSGFSASSAVYAARNSSHFAGSCPKRSRTSVLGATSCIHSSRCASARETPRGHSRSTRTRYPSSPDGSSIHTLSLETHVDSLRRSRARSEIDQMDHAVVGGDVRPHDLGGVDHHRTVTRSDDQLGTLETVELSSLTGPPPRVARSPRDTAAPTTEAPGRQGSCRVRPSESPRTLHRPRERGEGSFAQEGLLETGRLDCFDKRVGAPNCWTISTMLGISRHLFELDSRQGVCNMYPPRPPSLGDGLARLRDAPASTDASGSGAKTGGRHPADLLTASSCWRCRRRPPH